MSDEKILIGWREWVALPALGIPAVKAKVDTGARTSALHAFVVEPFTEGGAPRVRFGIHPLRRRTEPTIYCFADVVDERFVIDSGGHREFRQVIRTPIRLGEQEWETEITLTNRETMLFRMLLGRTAIEGRAVVDAGVSFRCGRYRRGSYPGTSPKRKG